jgi:PAS domain S-box-containing protein
VLRESIRQLQAEVDWLRLLFHKASDIFVLLNTEGIVTEVNARFEEEIERKRRDVVGKSVFTELDLPPQSVELLRDGLRHILTNREAVTLEFFDRNSKGQSVPYEVRAVPILRGERIEAIQATLRNISERKRYEQDLRNSEETLRVLLNATLNAAFLIDTRGIVLAVNEGGARRLERGVDEILGRYIGDFFPPEVAEKRRQMGLEVIRTGEPRQFEDEYEGKHFSNFIYPIFDEAGRVIKLAIHGINITEQKEAESEKRRLEIQLQRAQKMEAIGTLAGGIAHDFNNLMMAIQGNVSLMMLDTDPSHPHFELLKAIEKRIRSGAEMTSQLLGYARKGKYEVAPLDLNEVVRETATTFGRMRKDITIQAQYSDSLAGILADRGQLEQIFLNLFVNAADAMPTGGRLTLITRNTDEAELSGKPYRVKPGNYVCFEVADNGIGMDKEVMERIFDPFFTTKQMGRGTGLGLASVYGIVKSHGGYIEVNSRKGQGATFSLYFPASDQKVVKKPEDLHSPVRLRGTVLLVDDEPDVLAVTTAMLETMGFNVVSADSGREALALYRSDASRFDLVILDMIMPEMSGGELLDRLMAVEPNAKVLLASGYAIEGQASELLKRGCAGFIQKPFGYKDLSAKLEQILGAP